MMSSKKLIEIKKDSLMILSYSGEIIVKLFVDDELRRMNFKMNFKGT